MMDLLDEEVYSGLDISLSLKVDGKQTNLALSVYGIELLSVRSK
jgi:hypothetical protein